MRIRAPLPGHHRPGARPLRAAPTHRAPKTRAGAVRRLEIGVSPRNTALQPRLEPRWLPWHADPMTDPEIRACLLDRLAALDAEDAATAGARSVVELDQSATGRLSRMDALQHQAMAQAQQRRRAAERLRIRAALERLDLGEYGFCTDCGEAIPADRLAIDPALARCAECTRSA